MKHTLQQFAVEFFNKILKERVLTQKDVAAQIDKTEQTASNYLRGISSFSLDMFQRFAEMLEIDVIDIVTEYHEIVVLNEKKPIWVENQVAEEKAKHGKNEKRNPDQIIKKLEKDLAVSQAMVAYYDNRWNEWQNERDGLLKRIWDLGGDREKFNSTKVG